MHIRAICGSFRRRVWHPAIPTLPSANPPTEFTEVSGVGYSPTDFTDAHRFFLLRQKLLWVLWVLWENSLVGSPNLCVSVQSVGEYLAHPETSVGSVGECGRCKKSIDFFVVTKFHCIFAM